MHFLILFTFLLTSGFSMGLDFGSGAPPMGPGSGPPPLFSCTGKTVEDALQKLGRNGEQVSRMSSEDQRNTMIVLLADGSKHSIQELQGMTTVGDLGSLVGLASIRDVLLWNHFRTPQELSRMSYDDQRNTLIVELNQATGKAIPELQGMNDFQLVGSGCQTWRMF